MPLEQLKEKLESDPAKVQFNDVMAVIDSIYQYTPTEFSNGLNQDKVVNPAGTNEGSCRLFAFAKEQNLSESQTLHCFGDFYRKDVLENPNGSDHANIRHFMKYGWEGIHFMGSALQKR